LQQGIKKLEESWFGKASLLKSYLISPVHDAAAKGNIEALDEIIASGTDINSSDATFNTPLHWASGAGHLPAVKWLVEHNSDLTKQNLLGDTALHRAVWREQTAVVRVLLEKGIDIATLNKDGKKAIDLVRGNIEIGAMLQGYDIEYQREFAHQIGVDGLGDYDISNDSEGDGQDSD